jgi:Flp pilus assembly pilin Flp
MSVKAGRQRRMGMETLWKRLWYEEQGQDLTEYALILVLISLVAIASMKFFGSRLKNVYSNASANITATQK